MRALGLIGAISLVPALFAELLGVAFFHDRPMCSVGFFPIVWFASFGGWVALAVDSLMGLHPTRGNGFHVWMWIIAVQAICAMLPLAICFGLTSQSRGTPTAAKVIGLVLLANVMLGLLPLLPIVLND